MAMLGKRRPSRRHSGHSGLARSPAAASAQASPAEEDNRVTIERLAHDGRGVAHLASGKTLFVDQALPGETVKVAIHRTRKRFDEAHLKVIEVASPQRIEPPCAHFGHCGGCDLQHLSIDAQRAHKRQVVSELFARQGVALDRPVQALDTQTQAYRRRARLGVKVDSHGKVLLGFRAKDTHRLVNIHTCMVLVPALQALLAPLHELLGQLEAPRHVGHIELIATRDSCVVVIRQLREHAADKVRWQAFADSQALALGTLLGREAPELNWYGAPPVLQDIHDDLVLTFAPGDFLQVNAEVNQKVIAQVLAWLAITPDQQVLDLFAGIGNFSLPLAAAGADVQAVEGSATMVARITANAHTNHLAVAAMQADLNQPEAVAALLAERRLDAVVLDPPRSGAETVCQALGRHPVKRVVYVSCDPATLARDAAQLVQAGYRIVEVAVADMFLHTAHMETLVLFEHRHG
ncbi:23S rRNA (uracil(1939)-C(5))-methyltransferase RlmD [Halomonas sediminis]